MGGIGRYLLRESHQGDDRFKLLIIQVSILLEILAFLKIMKHLKVVQMLLSLQFSKILPKYAYTAAFLKNMLQVKHPYYKE